MDWNISPGNSDMWTTCEFQNINSKCTHSVLSSHKALQHLRSLLLIIHQTRNCKYGCMINQREWWHIKNLRLTECKVTDEDIEIYRNTLASTYLSCSWWPQNNLSQTQYGCVVYATTISTLHISICIYLHFIIRWGLWEHSLFDNGIIHIP